MSKGTQPQKQYKVLLIGELCQDVYVFGDVSRISPEAPVPVLKKIDKSFKAGMSGNVANNLSAILPGVSLTLCQNDMSCLKKIRFIDNKSNYHLMRYDIQHPFEGLKIDNIPDDNYDLVVVSDYDKGLIDNTIIHDICERFKDIKIFVDTKKSNLSAFKNCTIKLNEKESNLSKYKNQSCDIITTLGPQGCEYKGKIYPTQRVEVYDVCGAGDVFLATLIARWLETKDMEAALKAANNCAALSVTKLGCYTLTREEYENLCI